MDVIKGILLDLDIEEVNVFVSDIPHLLRDIKSLKRLTGGIIPRDFFLTPKKIATDWYLLGDYSKDEFGMGLYENLRKTN